VNGLNVDDSLIRRKIDVPICCGKPMSKIWFTESEYSKGIKTGRTRRAVSHLLCDSCGKEEIVDDSFDTPWSY
jgi:hypothetical protein